VLIALLLGLMAAGIALSVELSLATRAVGVVLLLGGAVAAIRTSRRHPLGFAGLEASGAALASHLDRISPRRRRLAIALASFLALFFELLIIRWHASCFQLFAYYKNVSLISCFLGLGIGFTLTRGRMLLPLLVPAMSAQLMVLHAMRLLGFGSVLNNPVPSNLALGLGQSQLLAVTRDILPGQLVTYGFLLAVFVLNALAFLPLGQLVGRLMESIGKLEAYSWNLAGSIVGVIGFTATAFLWSPPELWFGVAVLGTLPFLVPCARSLSCAVAAATAAFIVLSLPFGIAKLEVHSPYQLLALSLAPDRPPVLLVNHTYYQRILDLRPESVGGDPKALRRVAYYELPFRVAPSNRSTLILGSGLGNDVAAGLRSGCRHIDAVEIDPAIHGFGRRLHPERPYLDERVDVHLTDARRFVRNSDAAYDLIVYGLLDSHTLLSSRSSVRLDSFVYTSEGFTEAAAHLNEQGLLAVSFSLLSREQGKKLYLMLREAFDGQDPLILASGYDMGFTFLAGPGLDDIDLGGVPFADVTADFSSPQIDCDPATDDWPFLYLARRSIPLSYVIMVGALGLISLVSIAHTVPRARTGFSWVCFFLGAGFMLVETKGITELGLLLGSTWQVVSLIIVAILVLAFLANWVILRWGSPRPAITYALLVGSVAVGFALLRGGSGLAERYTVVYLAGLVLPVFFSGIAFSSELNRSASVGVALSSNLMGAMVGGFLEYASMRHGFDALYGLALVVYGLAWVASRHSPRSRTSIVSPTTR
jgi:hypothetical protein